MTAPAEPVGHFPYMRGPMGWSARAVGTAPPRPGPYRGRATQVIIQDAIFCMLTLRGLIRHTRLNCNGRGNSQPMSR